MIITDAQVYGRFISEVNWDDWSVIQLPISMQFLIIWNQHHPWPRLTVKYLERIVLYHIVNWSTKKSGFIYGIIWEKWISERYFQNRDDHFFRGTLWYICVRRAFETFDTFYAFYIIWHFFSSRFDQHEKSKFIFDENSDVPR